MNSSNFGLEMILARWPGGMAQFRTFCHNRVDTILNTENNVIFKVEFEVKDDIYSRRNQGWERKNDGGH